MNFLSSQIFEEAEVSKKHLKTASEEIFLAAKSISKVVFSLATDPDFNRDYPKLSHLLQIGIQTVHQIKDQIEFQKKEAIKPRAKPNGKIRKRKKT